MTKAQIKRLLAKIKKHRDIVAKQRDELREILTELEQLDESWSDAVESLDGAVWRLSELV